MADNGTILIIDDDNIQRKLLVGILKNQYSTFEAENGLIGLNFAKENAKKISWDDPP